MWKRRHAGNLGDTVGKGSKIRGFTSFLEASQSFLKGGAHVAIW
jgi:hypothetical protein